MSVGYGLGRLRFCQIVSHPKKCKGRGRRLDLENRNQCECSDARLSFECNRHGTAGPRRTLAVSELPSGELLRGTIITLLSPVTENSLSSKN